MSIPSRGRTAHVDTFTRDHLPPIEQQPVYLFDLPELQFPPQLNCAAEILDAAIARGWGGRPCIVGPGVRWTYANIALVRREHLPLFTKDLDDPIGAARCPLLAVG